MPVYGTRRSPYSYYLCCARDIAAVGTIFNIFCQLPDEERLRYVLNLIYQIRSIDYLPSFTLSEYVWIFHPIELEFMNLKSFPYFLKASPSAQDSSAPGILRNETMDDKFVYIPNYEKQQYLFCTSKVLVNTLGF